MFARLLWLLENSDLKRVIPLISNWQSRTHTYSVKGMVCLWSHSVLVELIALYFHSVKDSTKDLNVRSQVLTFYWCVLFIALLKLPESLFYCLKATSLTSLSSWYPGPKLKVELLATTKLYFSTVFFKFAFCNKTFDYNTYLLKCQTFPKSCQEVKIQSTSVWSELVLLRASKLSYLSSG